jgi:hypothetical protein
MSVGDAANAGTERPRTFTTHSESWSTYDATVTALFRLYPGGRAVLQHVRHTEVDRGPEPSRCRVDTEPLLDDVDDSVLDGLRGRGFDIAAGRAP